MSAHTRLPQDFHMNNNLNNMIDMSSFLMKKNLEESAHFPLDEEEEYMEKIEEEALEDLEGTICFPALEPVWSVMREHRSYFQCFLSTHHILFVEDGPLSPSTRNAIALLATARFGCSFLEQNFKEEFLNAGGDPEWIGIGLSSMPKKIQKLYEIIKVLAHQPWKLSQLEISELLGPGEHSWSISELVYIIVLVLHIQSLTSFVQGCASPEIHTKDFSRSIISPVSSFSKEDLKSLMCQSPRRADDLLFKLNSLKVTDYPEEELSQRFWKVTPQDSEENIKPVKEPKSKGTLFSRESEFKYEDFTQRGKENQYPTFRIQDFNWDEDGFSLLSQFYPLLADSLDEKFSHLVGLTYGTLGRHDRVDTAPFRRAAWNYSQCLWGVRHDDYDYGEVNVLLNRNLKKYMKTVSCSPEQCLRSEYNQIMKDFQSSEKIHLMLLVCEAKFQSGLLYSLRAISRYFYNS